MLAHVLIGKSMGFNVFAVTQIEREVKNGEVNTNLIVTVSFLNSVCPTTYA